MNLPVQWRFLLGFLLLVMLMAVIYLLPHEISINASEAGMTYAKGCYHSEMGMIKRAFFFNANNELVGKVVIAGDGMPLYDIMRRHHYLQFEAHEQYEYANPKLHHWSRWVIHMDSPDQVVIEDLNQDGIAEKCYIESQPPNM